MSCSIDRVPLELICEFLSILKDDPPSLSSCSLVSAQWHQLAIPYLFSSITFQSSHHRPLTAFRDFVTSHSHLAKWIKMLTLGETPFQEAQALTFSGSEYISGMVASYDELMSILRCLVVLEKVVLKGEFVLAQTSSLLPRIPLKSLSINPQFEYGLDLWHPSVIGTLLRIFSPDTLEIRGVVVGESDQITSRHTLNNPRRLIICQDSTRGTQQYLLENLAPDNLRHLTSSVDHEWQASEVLLSLIDSAGRKLESLELDVRQFLDPDLARRWQSDDSPLPDDRWQSLGKTIAQCDYLRSLTLILYMVPAFRLRKREWAAQELSIFTSIFSIAPRTLQEVTLGINLFPWEATPFTVFDLNALDNPWFRERFTSLRRLKVQFHRIGSRAEPLPHADATILQALPRLRDANLLEITTVVNS
ncbi:hypothetical protein C8T65DRAFT_67242 [Cerioporus squamosus]|nr:hypothetical protein C8T65DRAFT_67242 [Cerioporus squamosus]